MLQRVVLEKCRRRVLETSVVEKCWSSRHKQKCRQVHSYLIMAGPSQYNVRTFGFVLSILILETFCGATFTIPLRTVTTLSCDNKDVLTVMEIVVRVDEKRHLRTWKFWGRWAHGLRLFIFWGGLKTTKHIPSIYQKQKLAKFFRHGISLWHPGYQSNTTSPGIR